MAKKSPALPAKFLMQFEPTTIEHLGLNLYSSMPPVIGELVSNAWDAEATHVDITLPFDAIGPHSQVVVTDDGTGMDPEAVQSAYLFIGRDRRLVNQTEYSGNLKRKVTGRKGLGKLSAFGIANIIEVRTVRAGFATAIKLDLDQMRKWPRGRPYEPNIIKDESGKTKDQEGTTVTVKALRRQKPIDEGYIRRALARRFRFIGEGFAVSINGTPVQTSDRRQKKDCREAWDVKDLKCGAIVDKPNGWAVSGWIGILSKSSQVDRGVDIFSRGKAVELDKMLNIYTTHAQFARAYVVGEIHAEFLDSDEDRISTARNSVNWESEAGHRLQEWGSIALKDVFERWLELQHKEKREHIILTSNFDDWLSSRTTREQKIANRLVKIIVDDPDIDPDSAAPLLEIIKANVEFQAFQELVDEIEESGNSVKILLKLFRDWRVIEAREHLKLSDGRLEAMEKLAHFIDTGALEVKEMQPLFENNSWLIDPAWGNVTGQATYSNILRKQFPEKIQVAIESRRLDLLGLRLSSEINIVELKRPERVLHREDLEQIERYVDWSRGNLIGTADDAPRHARGLLIVGKLSEKSELQEKVRRLAGDDIRVETYDDLLHRARRVYGEVQQTLKNVAPEYSRDARKARKGPLPRKKPTAKRIVKQNPPIAKAKAKKV